MFEGLNTSGAGLVVSKLRITANESLTPPIDLHVVAEGGTRLEDRFDFQHILLDHQRDTLVGRSNPPVRYEELTGRRFLVQFYSPTHLLARWQLLYLITA